MIGWFDPTKKQVGKPDFKSDVTKNEQIKLEQNWVNSNPNAFTVEYKALNLTSSEWAKTYGTVENRSDRLIPVKKPIPAIVLNERKSSDGNAIAANVKTGAENKLDADEASLTDVTKSSEKAGYKAKVLKRRMVTQNGVAQWAKSGPTTQGLYVLHPSAPVNSVVEISNPMTHRKIYAKVLSNMPPKLYPDDISVVVSPGVANLLGAIDSRFYVKLRFIEETIQ